MKQNNNFNSNLNWGIENIDFNNVYVDILSIQDTLVNHIQTIIAHVYNLLEKVIFKNIEKRVLQKDKYNINLVNDPNKVSNECVIKKPSSVNNVDEDTENKEIRMCIDDENYNLNNKKKITCQKILKCSLENSKQNIIPYDKTHTDDELKVIRDVRNARSDGDVNDEGYYYIEKTISNGNNEDDSNNKKTNILVEKKSHLKDSDGLKKNVSNGVDDNVKKDSLIEHNLNECTLNGNYELVQKSILNANSNNMENKNIDNVINENKLKLKKHISLLELIKYVISYSSYSNKEQIEVKNNTDKNEDPNTSMRKIDENFKGNNKNFSLDLDNGVSNFEFSNFDSSSIKIKYINIISYYMELLSPFNKFYNEKSVDNMTEEKKLKLIDRKLDELILNYEYIVDEILKKNNFSGLPEEHLHSLKKKLMQGEFLNGDKSNNEINNTDLSNMLSSDNNKIIQDKKLCNEIKNISNNFQNIDMNSLLLRNNTIYNNSYAIKNVNDNVNNNFLYKMNMFNNNLINDINFDQYNIENVKEPDSILNRSKVNNIMQNKFIYNDNEHINFTKIQNNVQALHEYNLNSKIMYDINQKNPFNSLAFSDIRSDNTAPNYFCEVTSNLNNSANNFTNNLNENHEQINDFNYCDNDIINNRILFKQEPLNDNNNYIPNMITNEPNKEYMRELLINNCKTSTNNISKYEKTIHYNHTFENDENLIKNNQTINDNQHFCLKNTNANNLKDNYKCDNKNYNEVAKLNEDNGHDLFSFQQQSHVNKNNNKCDFLPFKQSYIKNSKNKQKYDDQENKIISTNEKLIQHVDKNVNNNDIENNINEFSYDKKEINHKMYDNKYMIKNFNMIKTRSEEANGCNNTHNFKDQHILKKNYNLDDMENYKNIILMNSNTNQLNNYNAENCGLYSNDILNNTSSRNTINAIKNDNKIHEVDINNTNDSLLDKMQTSSLMRLKDNYKSSIIFETTSIHHNKKSDTNKRVSVYKDVNDNINYSNRVHKDDTNGNDHNGDTRGSNNDGSNNDGSNHNNNDNNANINNSNNDGGNGGGNNGDNDGSNNDENNNNNSNSSDNSDDDNDSNGDNSNDEEKNENKKNYSDKKGMSSSDNNCSSKNNSNSSNALKGDTKEHSNDKCNLYKNDLNNPFDHIIENEHTIKDKNSKESEKNHSLIELNQNNIKDYTRTNEFSSNEENSINNNLNNFYNNVNKESINTNKDTINKKNVEKIISNNSVDGTFEKGNKDINDLHINNNFKSYNNDIMNNEVCTTSYFDVYNKFNEKNDTNNNVANFDKNNIEYDLINFANNTYIDIHRILQNNDILKNEYTNIEESFKAFPSMCDNKKAKTKHHNEGMLTMYDNYKNIMHSENVVSNEENKNQMHDAFFLNHNRPKNVSHGDLNSNMSNNDFDANADKIIDIMNINNDIKENNNRNKFPVNSEEFNKKNDNLNFSYMNNFSTDVCKKNQDKKRKINSIGNNNDIFPDGTKIENILEHTHSKKYYKNSEDKRKKYQKIDIRALNKNVKKNKEIYTNCYIHYDNFKSSYILTFINRKQKKQRKIFPVEPNEKDEAYIIQIMKYIGKLKEQDKIFGITKNQENQESQINQLNLHKNDSFCDFIGMNNMNKFNYVNKNYFLNTSVVDDHHIEDTLTTNCEINPNNNNSNGKGRIHNTSVHNNSINNNSMNSSNINNNNNALNNKMSNFMNPFNDHLYIPPNNISYLHDNIPPINNINNTNCIKNMNPNISKHLHIYDNVNMHSNLDYMNFNLLNDANKFENFNLINVCSNNPQDISMFYGNDKKDNLSKSVNDTYIDEINMLDNINSHNYNAFSHNMCDNNMLHNMKNMIYTCGNSINDMKPLKNNSVDENDKINMLNNINISNFHNIPNNECEIMQKYNSIMNEYGAILNNPNYDEMNNIGKGMVNENNIQHNE